MYSISPPQAPQAPHSPSEPHAPNEPHAPAPVPQPRHSLSPTRSDPSLTRAQAGHFLGLLYRNQRQADELLHFLNSKDPAAQLKAEAWVRLFSSCASIADNTSIRGAPRRSGHSLRGRADVQPPYRQSDLAAAERDACTLERITDQLMLHAAAVLQPATTRVRRRLMALELCIGQLRRRRLGPQARCDASHPHLSPLARRFIDQAIPNLNKARPHAPTIFQDMQFARELDGRLRQWLLLYQQINQCHDRLQARIPMPQAACRDLVLALAEAERHADHLRQSDCQRCLLRFDLQLFSLNMAGIPSTEV